METKQEMKQKTEKKDKKKDLESIEYLEKKVEDPEFIGGRERKKKKHKQDSKGKRQY